MTRTTLILAAVFTLAIPNAGAWTTYGPKWPAMPITVETNTAGLPKGVKANEHVAALDYALERWEDLYRRNPAASIDFAPVQTTTRTAYVITDGHWRWNQDGHSVVQYANFLALGIPSYHLAITGYYTDGKGNRVESDILINSAYPFDATLPIDKKKYDLAALLTHEIGHLLGLGESNVAACGVMCKTLRLGQSIGFTADDLQGAAALYPG